MDSGAPRLVTRLEGGAEGGGTTAEETEKGAEAGAASFGLRTWLGLRLGLG